MPDSRRPDLTVARSASAAAAPRGAVTLVGRWRGVTLVALRGTVTVVALLAAVPALAQPRLVDPGQKTVRVVRTDTPPVIDGVLDDAVWQKAALIDDLHQVNPVEYAEPSERTEVYILYDDRTLYIGAKLYEPQDEITANVLRQNSAMTSDDTLFITIDPFNGRRGGYFFGINPNGVRMDGLYRNVSEYYSDWDTIFDAKTARFDGGWSVEYEIPFNSISFDPNSDTWGFNVSRTIQSRSEDIAWVSRNRRWDPSSAGLAVGFEGIEQGVGLDIIPSVSTSRSQTKADPVAGTPQINDSTFEPSLDLVYKLTSQLNASLTINTDFSATEVDDRQVNLTRFSLFFPEKRDFFLREADIFEFGRIGAQGGFGGGADRQNGRPFFSRRIGLAPDGSAVGLDYGGKISGRIGRFEIGALSIRQDAYAGVDAGTLSVVRGKAGIGEESTVGFIYTNGDPSSNLDNTVVGVDYLYRNSRLPGGRTLEAYTWLQQSDTANPANDPALVGDNGAAGVGFTLPSNVGIRAGASVKEFERNFNPALGFMSRRGVRDTAADVGYTYRPAGGYWQSLFFTIDYERFDVIDGGLQSQKLGVTPLEITSRKGDTIFVRSNFESEVLDQPFEISRGVVIAPGRYDFDNHGAEYRSAGYRKIGGRAAYVKGSFYDGHQVRMFGNVTYRPSPKFRGSVGFNITEVSLPEGDFTTRLITTGLDWVFSSTLSWVNLIQYDNVSNTAGINMRLHWIPQAGREMFFVINHTLEKNVTLDRFESTFTDATFKVSYTYRF